MKEEKIEPLPCFRDFFNYFTKRAKRVLKLKNDEFDSIHMDVYNDCPSTGNIVVWFFKKTEIIAKIDFLEDGRCINKFDYRK